MGLFLAAPAPNPARALVMRLPAIGFGAAEVAAAGFGADESDEVTVADAATDAATDATDVPDLSYLLGTLVNPTMSFIEFLMLAPALLLFSRGLARSTAVLNLLSHIEHGQDKLYNIRIKYT